MGTQPSLARTLGHKSVLSCPPTPEHSHHGVGGRDSNWDLASQVLVCPSVWTDFVALAAGGRQLSRLGF